MDSLGRENEKLIRSTQRRMMRKIAGVRRRIQDAATTACTSSSSEENSSSSDDGDDNMQAEESWAEWIQRSTHIVINAQRKAGAKDWTAEVRRRFWRFAGHTARRTDCRWNTVLLDWVPEDGHRFPWRPKMRWADPINKYFLSQGVATLWCKLAQDRKRWSAAEDGFMSF